MSSKTLMCDYSDLEPARCATATVSGQLDGCLTRYLTCAVMLHDISRDDTRVTDNVQTWCVRSSSLSYKRDFFSGQTNAGAWPCGAESEVAAVQGLVENHVFASVTDV
jgi:hypothetical protein